jgi:Phage tail tube protein
MPLSSFRTWVGGSMDRINGQTSAAITTTTSQAVALSNVVGSIASTGYAFIIDGPNTEVLAYTTGSSSGTTGTITVTPTLSHNANTYVALQATNSPAFYLPLEKIAPADEYAQLLDQSYQGSSVKTYAAIQGMRTSTWDISGAVFADTFGYLVGGIFGAEDYTAGTPSQHAFGVDNTTDQQPTPLILWFYDGLNTRVYAGGKFTDLTLTLDPGALMAYTAKFMARASGVYAGSSAIASVSTLKPLAAWTGSLTVAGTAVGQAQSFEINFSRQNSENVMALTGQQDPATIWVGPLQVTGKVTYWKNDDVQYNYVTANTQPAVVITSTQGSGTTTGLNVQMTKCNVFNPKIVVDSKPYVIEEFEFEGIANSTDATTAGGGVSPAKVTLKNAIASGTTYC